MDVTADREDGMEAVVAEEPIQAVKVKVRVKEDIRVVEPAIVKVVEEVVVVEVDIDLDQDQEGIVQEAVVSVVEEVVDLLDVAVLTTTITLNPLKVVVEVSLELDLLEVLDLVLEVGITLLLNLLLLLLLHQAAVNHNNRVVEIPKLGWRERDRCLRGFSLSESIKRVIPEKHFFVR